VSDSAHLPTHRQRGPRPCARKCVEQARGRFLEVRVADDGVPAVDALRFVPGELHGHLSRDAGALQFRTAGRRKSWRIRPGTWIFSHAVAQAFAKLRRRYPTRR